MQRFGEKLRMLRKRHHMNHVQLAAALGYASSSYISTLETGKKKPTAELVIKVAHLFNVTTDALMLDEVEPVELEREETIVQRFGEKLRTLRQHHGLTQRGLAHALGYTDAHSYISDFENGKRKATLEFALRIAQFFNVTTDQLVNDHVELDLSE